MRTKDLIINDTDIIELFMRKDVEEILITTDLRAFNLTEENFGLKIIENCDWVELVDFGMKNIICTEFYYAEKVPYNKVTAVLVRYSDADKYGNEVETFINKNFSETIKSN
jgi:hypothetical protein